MIGRKAEEGKEGMETYDNIDRLVQVQDHPILVDNRHRADPPLRKDMNDVEDTCLHRRCAEREEAIADSHRMGRVFLRIRRLRFGLSMTGRFVGGGFGSGG